MDGALKILKIGVVARVSESIMPGVEYRERSTVDVRMEYCTAAPPDWAGIVAE
jgi:hypothetical protein